MTASQLLNRVVAMGPRNTPALTKVAANRLASLAGELGLQVAREAFVARGETYENLLIGDVWRPGSVILMAHYDTLGPTSGACDNSSGVAVALAACHASQGQVAAVLTACEEPPFFCHRMGSEAFEARHRQALVQGDHAVLVVDSLGYTDVATWPRQPRHGHPTGRVASQRELVLLAPRADPGLVSMGVQLARSIPTCVDTANSPVIQLSDARNLDRVRAALLVDSMTMAVPFHTARDAVGSVDLGWLDRAGAALSLAGASPRPAPTAALAGP